MLFTLQKLFLSVAAAFACIFLAAPLSTSQTLPFKNFTTADGLGHDFVNRIVRDSRGFLWFCTGEGLSRFDGIEFRNYTQADGLPHREVNDLLEIDGGKYVAATADGVAVFDPTGTGPMFRPSDSQTVAQPMFRTFRSSEPPFDSNPFSALDLYQSPDKGIFVSTVSGIFRFSVQNGLEAIGIEEWRGKRIEVLSTFQDTRGTFWVATSTGVWTFDERLENGRRILDTSARVVHEDRAGRIWVTGGDRSEGLSVFEYQAGRPVLTRRFTTADGLTDNTWIHSILETTDGRVLVGIRNGLCEFVPDSKPGAKQFRVLFSTDVVSLGEDAGGNIWIGTGTRGAFKLTRNSFVLFDIPEKPPYGSVTSIFSSGAEVFVTSSSDDLLRFDGEGFVEIGPAGRWVRSWGWNQLDVRSQIDGEWWIPTSTGLFRYPAETEIPKLAAASPKRVYRKVDGLSADDIFRLFEDSRGDLWFSNISRAGVMRWDRKTDTVRQFSAAENTPDHSAPTAFGEDSAGNIWLGFYTGGVARYRNGTFEFFNSPERFPPGLVNAVYRDSRGRLWVAISNSGIVRIDNPADETPVFTRISVSEGLSSNQANCITEDDSGRVYVGTARGINRFDPESGRIRLFTQADGLPGGNINRCARDTNGSVWFAQKFTIARLNPRDAKASPPPPIFIAGLRVNGETVRHLSELGETVIKDLYLDTDQRQLQIDFFSLAFAAGESLKYQHRFGNSDWSEPLAQRNVNLNLTAGSYDFQVRAISSDGVVSEAPATITFSIARPVWQRWWFLLLTALIVGGVVYAAYRNRLRRLIELERVRTRIATDLHDDIGSSLSQIAILSEVVRQKVGDKDANEPLNMIAESSREMIDSMSDIVWAIDPNKDSLHDLVNRMRRFASDILEAKDIAYRFHLPPTGDFALGADVRREIYLMFKECVNNLAKHAQATEADLMIAVEDDRLTIRISDNGRGFQMRSEENHLPQEGLGGNGLNNLRRRAESLGGSFEVESEIGKGTVVTVRVPIRANVMFGGLRRFVEG